MNDKATVQFDISEGFVQSILLRLTMGGQRAEDLAVPPGFMAHNVDEITPASHVRSALAILFHRGYACPVIHDGRVILWRQTTAEERARL